MTDYMIEGLAKKRAEIAGEIERTHDALRKLAIALEHVDATLHIIAPETAVKAIKPKVCRPPSRISGTRLAGVNSQRCF